MKSVDCIVAYLHIVPVFSKTSNMIFLFFTEFPIRCLELYEQRLSTGYPKNSVWVPGVGLDIELQTSNTKVPIYQVARLEFNLGLRLHIRTCIGRHQQPYYFCGRNTSNNGHWGEVRMPCHSAWASIFCPTSF